MRRPRHSAAASCEPLGSSVLDFSTPSCRCAGLQVPASVNPHVHRNWMRDLFMTLISCGALVALTHAVCIEKNSIAVVRSSDTSAGWTLELLVVGRCCNCTSVPMHTCVSLRCMQLPGSRAGDRHAIHLRTPNTCAVPLNSHRTRLTLGWCRTGSSSSRRAAIQRSRCRWHGAPSSTSLRSWACPCAWAVSRPTLKA